MRIIPIVALAIFTAGCKDRPANGGSAVETPHSHYEIDGFYVFPLQEVLIGQTTGDIEKSLGRPAETFRRHFREPNRVKLSELPEFDEQWGYFEGMGNRWVFFREGAVVAAFREESDF